MGQHAKFSPSGAHRWVTCPGSVRLSENIESPPSTYAMEGTILHTLTEKCMREKIDPYILVGSTHVLDKEGEFMELEITDEHADAIDECLAQVKSLMMDYGIVKGRLEIRVNITDNCWGTVDVLLWNTDIIIVIDFKFGRGKSVEAEGNSQEMLYLLGAARYLHEQKIPVPKNALLAIIQPRIPPSLRKWETTVDSIATWFDKSVKPAFSEAENPEAVCNPGEEQCQFCPANGACTARANYLLGLAESEFHQFVIDPAEGSMLPEIVHHSPRDFREMMVTEILTPEIASKILGYQPDFDNFFKKVGEWSINQALAGTPIPGMKLVQGKSNRKWKDKPKTIEAILKDQFKIADPFTKKILSPAQAEKKLKKDVRGELAEYIIKPPGKTILVDKSDTRPSIETIAEQDMSEFACGTELPKKQTVTGNNEEITLIDSPSDSLSTDDVMAQAEALFSGATEVLAEGAEIAADAITTVSEAVDVALTEAGKQVAGLGEAIKEVWASNRASTEPSKRTKRYDLLQRGLEGGASVKQASDELFGGNEGNMLRGLRQLVDRDGYTVEISGKETFTVKA